MYTILDMMDNSSSHQHFSNLPNRVRYPCSPLVEFRITQDFFNGPVNCSITQFNCSMHVRNSYLENRTLYFTDQAQQQYLSQFKFPERHNITYHLWSLGAYSVMIRCGYHGVYKDPSQKVSRSKVTFYHNLDSIPYHLWSLGTPKVVTTLVQ